LVGEDWVLKKYQEIKNNYNENLFKMSWDNFEKIHFNNRVMKEMDQVQKSMLLRKNFYQENDMAEMRMKKNNLLNYDKKKKFYYYRYTKNNIEVEGEITYKDFYKMLVSQTSQNTEKLNEKNISLYNNHILLRFKELLEKKESVENFTSEVDEHYCNMLIHNYIEKGISSNLLRSRRI